MDTISPFHHCTISPSQGEIANVTSVHSTISTSQDSTIPPSQGEISSVTSESQISSINVFNELTTKSTINDSDGDEAERDPNSDPKVATYTTNGNYPQKLFINRLIPKIILGKIVPIDQPIT